MNGVNRSYLVSIEPAVSLQVQSPTKSLTCRSGTNIAFDGDQDGRYQGAQTPKNGGGPNAAKVFQKDCKREGGKR